MNSQHRTPSTAVHAAARPATVTAANTVTGTGGTGGTASERLHADHLSLKRLGNWTTANRFEIRNRRGAVVLDLRSPQIPAGNIVVDLDIDRGMVKLLVAEDAVIEYWDVAWTGRGKVKDGAGVQHARAAERAGGSGGTDGSDGSDGADRTDSSYSLDGSAPRPRRVVLVGRVQDGEIRVARGGVAMLAAMFSREYVDDLRRAHREGTNPTVDDPTRELVR